MVSLRILPALLATVSTSCGTISPALSQGSLPTDGIVRNRETLRTVSPIAFLDYLKSRALPVSCRTVSSEVRLIVRLSNWVKREDLQNLAKRLNSRVPCGRVLMGPSAAQFEYESTEGEQAFFILCGYIQNYYPPDPGVCDYTFAKHFCEVQRVKRLLDKEHIYYPPLATWAFPRQIVAD